MKAYDDFTFDAVTWTLTAHEARPGHELQFATMVEKGVSMARAPCSPSTASTSRAGPSTGGRDAAYDAAGRPARSLQLRLMRAARAFLDPELQMGRIQPDG